MKRLILYIAVLFLVAGCQDYPYDGISATAEVHFSVTLPASTQVNSRAAVSDTDVENIDVLIFNENGQFIERMRIDDITGSGSTKSFSLKLDYTPNARTFHLIANGRNASDVDVVNFNAVTPLMSESTALSQLRTNDVFDEASITPLVMWGRVSVSSVTQSIININNARLIRSQAAIVMRTDAPTAENGLNKFDLMSFTLCDASAYGWVVPENYSSSDIVPNSVTVWGTFPNLINYTDTGYWNDDPASPMYLYERKNHTSDYVSLIVRGDYDGTEGYYKVVLANDGTLMDIVRNHRYIVTVVKADGIGYATVQEAADNPPSNALKVNITDSYDDIFLMVADSGNELGVSVNHIELKGAPHATNIIELATLFSTRMSLTAMSTSSNLTNLTITPKFDGTSILKGIWSANAATPTEIVVSDGYLTQRIKVEMSLMTDNDISGNTSTYSYKIADETSVPWSVSIIEGYDRARLHYDSYSPTFDATDRWGYGIMESRVYYPEVYLHVNKSNVVPVLVKYSRLDDTGSLRVGRIIINK